ncbi:MAG: flagellar biosynthesis protein FlhF [Candidatus Pristimantibacillus sp.]
MRVKRYIVNALPEALPMIRSELGKDAVILNTKEIRVGGFLGMFGKKKMEVIAAIESNVPPSIQQRKQSADINAVMSAITESVQRSTSTAVMEPPSSLPLQTPAAAPTPSPVQAVARINDELLDEIRVIKQSLLQLSIQKVDNQLSESLKLLYDRLVDQEMDPEWIGRLVNEITDRQSTQAEYFNHAEVWGNARELLTQWMEPFAHESIQADTRIVHFVGPTGVGKTTTIAKLAAEQTIKNGRHVGFITSDTYRIAAVDQLRTYANILNVPIEVVFSPMDLPKAFKQLEDRDLIYMDTAGRNFRNELNVSEVYSLLQTSDKSETVLVLSLTGKTKDMITVAENFVKYGVNKVLFTKLDETSVYGSIFNLVMNYQLNPIFVARGQTVPDDIELFRTDAYVNDLLGAAGNE